MAKIYNYDTTKADRAHFKWQWEILFSRNNEKLSRNNEKFSRNNEKDFS